MDPQTNAVSKYIVWILIAAGVIVLVIAFVVRNSSKDDAARDFSEELAQCEEDLAELNGRLDTATRTPQIEAELQALIERCSEVVEQAREAQ
jgi:hypothetical protein